MFVFCGWVFLMMCPTGNSFFYLFAFWHHLLTTLLQDLKKRYPKSPGGLILMLCLRTAFLWYIFKTGLKARAIWSTVLVRIHLVPSSRKIQWSGLQTVSLLNYLQKGPYSEPQRKENPMLSLDWMILCKATSGAPHPFSVPQFSILSSKAFDILSHQNSVQQLFAFL